MYFGGWTKGFWADEGIDLTITRGYGSGDTVTKNAGKGAKLYERRNPLDNRTSKHLEVRVVANGIKIALVSHHVSVIRI